MTIKLAEIELCFEKLMSYLRARGIEEVDPGEHDYYWQILCSDWMDFDRDPDPAVGSLADDLSELTRLASGENPPTVLDLDRLASALLLLSYQISEE